MSKIVPTKIFGDDEEWLLLSKVLGRRVIFRADAINTLKKRPKDFDGHECDEAHARSSVKCRGRDIIVKDSVLNK